MSSPAYLRIFNVLREKILAREYPPGHKFPPEREFAKEFGVSQITIRHALRLLQEHSLVERRRRFGTTVREIWPTSKLRIRIADYAESILRNAPDLERKLLKYTRSVPRKSVLEVLELGSKDKCLFAVRLDVWRSEPLAFDRVWIPTFFAGSIDEEMMSKIDFLSLWMEAEGLSLSYVMDAIGAMGADDSCVERLGVRGGFPILTMREVLYDPDRRPLGVFETCYRSDCFNLYGAHRPSS